MSHHIYQKGSLLIEILIAVSIFGVIAAIAAQGIVASLASNSVAGARSAQAQLLAEVLQGIRAASDENWSNLYTLSATGTHYYVALSGGKWIITQGDEALALDARTYTRYFTVENVSRDPTTRAIESPYTVGHDDPSTRLVHVFVMASGTNQLTADEYFFRWRNQVCGQTAWTAANASGAKTCPDTSYVNTVNITPGTSLQLCMGGC